MPPNISTKYQFKKLLDTRQIREADQYTIQKKGISSLELMEAAAYSFVKEINPGKLKGKKIAVVCGIGNNGGDGLAAARILRKKGLRVDVFLVKFKEKLSPDCKTNYKRLKNILLIDSTSAIPSFSGYDIIVDSLLGSGLKGATKGLVAMVINAINQAEKTVYAIDVPSGLSGETIGEDGSIVQADRVVSFQRPKLSFFLPENSSYVKSWSVAAIGLDERFIQEMPSANFILDEHITCMIKKRARQSHKGSYGHALLMTGSYGKIGASVLSAKACLRSGVGLLTCYLPQCGYQVLQCTVPEAMCLTDENAEILTQFPDLGVYTAIGIGCGIGKSTLTFSMIENLLKKRPEKLVLDADAINIIAENKALEKLIPAQSILTPHIKEFDRWVGQSDHSLERFQKQISLSKQLQCIIVLKNAYTSISSPDGALYFNTTGNAGMATAGSGDVLTGIITGLLAQGYDPLLAALIGVYFHGKAGDKASEKRGENALIASDIIDFLRI